MPTEDMSADKARRIRRILLNLVDKSEIYPRRGTHIDSVSLALFWRMAELHESICSLVVRGHRRDAAVLGRTLCEALITCYWLTNKDQDRRFDRYVNFWGKVRHENIARTTKYFNYRYVPKSPIEISLIEHAKAEFRRNQWNEKHLADMAREALEGERRPDGTCVSLDQDYELFYFWLSLASHPSVMAIECFLPSTGEPFDSARPPRPYLNPAEDKLVFLSTIWLFRILMRINKTLKLKYDARLERIFRAIKE